MKKFIATAILSTFFLFFAVITFVSADTTTKTRVETKERSSATGTQMREEERGSSTSTERSERDESEKEREQKGMGSSVSENHRSAVASFVQSLLKVADRESGIGTQVREVAQSQNDSSSTTVKAIKEVENRSSLKTFFFGSDYKNLGTVRSELSKTSNSIERLKRLAEQAMSTTTKNEIESQIKALQDDQTKVQSFVNSQEKIFSLFGWFNRLFVK